MNHHTSSPPTRQTSTSISTSSDSNTGMDLSSPFDMIQRIFLDPMSTCYAEEAYNMVEDSDTREWSLESSHAGSMMSGNGDQLYDQLQYPHQQRQYDEDEESEVTLNGLLIDDTQSRRSSRTVSTTMARENSSSSRSSFGIPVLRDLPSTSFSTSSFVGSHVGGSPGRGSHVGRSPGRYGGSTTPSFSEESSIMSEYESKLPNINTIRRPINPAMLP